MHQLRAFCLRDGWIEWTVLPDNQSKLQENGQCLATAGKVTQLVMARHSALFAMIAGKNASVVGRSHESTILLQPGVDPDFEGMKVYNAHKGNSKILPPGFRGVTTCIFRRGDSTRSLNDDLKLQCGVDEILVISEKAMPLLNALSRVDEQAARVQRQAREALLMKVQPPAHPSSPHASPASSVARSQACAASPLTLRTCAMSAGG